MGKRTIKFNYCLRSLVWWLVALSPAIVEIESSSPATVKMAPELQEEYCKNFTYGNPVTKEFFSPGYPRNYPAGIKCFRTISADYGYFVRVDFRDYFNIEPPTNEGSCDYDYLEIRDGDQGYSTLIDKYCGSNFPPIITSSGRSLWLRFVSDGTIEYQGFKAVYDFIPNPMEIIPFIPKCEFEIGGAMDYIGTANISEEHLAHAHKWGIPVDCTWIIRAEEGKKIYLQFPLYNLNEPNDCNFNFIQIFDEKTDIEHRKRNFCGSVAESYQSETDVLFIRYFADGKGIGSEFEAYFTTLRKIGSLEEFEKCPEEEYDCDDATCISKELVCNSVRNCKGGWDEEICAVEGSAIPLDFSAPHVIIILILLIMIMIGMCVGMVYNLMRKLSEDKEDILSSREKSLASIASMESVPHVAHAPLSVPDIPSPPKSRASRYTDNECSGCYVPAPPEGAFPFHSKF